MTDISIRAATPPDGPLAAPLILESGESLFCYLFYPERGRTIDLIARLFAWEANEFTFESSWIAEQEGAVRGVAQLVDRRELARNENGTGRAITAELGLFGLLRRLPRFGRFGKLVAPIGDDALYLKMLAVNAARRGQGIGTRLLDHAGELAQKRGLTSVALDVRADNDGALRLYERFGFVRGELSTDDKLARAIGFSGFVRMELGL
jgi:ribosomal protein S18 acetylase RimI-like enzyme